MPSRLVALPVVLLAVALGACTAASAPQPSPTPSTSEPAAACGEVQGQLPGEPAARLTPLALCEVDGLPWAATAAPDAFPLFIASGSDVEACAALDRAFEIGLLGVGSLMRGLSAETTDDAGLPVLGGAVVRVALLDDPQHAAYVGASLDAMATSCSGSTGFAGTVAADDVDDWHGVRIDDAAASETQRIHWLAADELLAIVQTDEGLDDAVLDVVLETQAALLEDPPPATAWPADCAASPPWAAGEERLAVDAATLCEADGRPWVSAGVATFERIRGADLTSGCAPAADAGPVLTAETSLELSDGGAWWRLGDRPEHGGAVSISVIDDPAAAATAAAALDAGLACVGVGGLGGDPVVQAVVAVPPVEGWSSLGIEVAPSDPAYPDPVDVVQHWATIDDALVAVQAPADLDPDAVQTVLDAQRAALGG